MTMTNAVPTPMTTAVPTSHIRLDERGVAWVDDRNVKVIEVALDMIAYGATADHIYDLHDGYLSMSQIHAALSYYFDHRAEYDAEIERQVREDDDARAKNWNSPVRAKLRALGLIP
ncbi:MAG: hypothetical protein ACKV2Q_35610 [Planctomycetaceae bacterium]